MFAREVLKIMVLKSFAAGILFLLVSGYQLQAQLLKKFFSEIEIIGGLGTTHYFGDIGGQDPDIKGVRAFFDNLDIDLWQTRVALTAGLRVASTKSFTMSLQIAPMILSGSDQRSKYAKQGRNFAFNTKLAELSLQGEYYFANRMTQFAPYVFAGIGAIAYSVDYTENTLNPDPASTPWYAGNTFIFGLGARLPPKNKFIHTIDFGYHFTTTDFLDAFKTDRSSNDLFFQLSYKINIQVYNNWFSDHKGLVR